MSEVIFVGFNINCSSLLNLFTFISSVSINIKYSLHEIVTAGILKFTILRVPKNSELSYRSILAILLCVAKSLPRETRDARQSQRFAIKAS